MTALAGRPADLERGTLPGGMPEDVLQHLDFEKALEIVAGDIAENCSSGDNGDGHCQLASQLMKAEQPVRYADIKEHIPPFAAYTADEVRSIFCTVAAHKEHGVPMEGSDLDIALQKADEALKKGDFDGYDRESSKIRKITESIASQSAYHYQKWLAACV